MAASVSCNSASLFGVGSMAAYTRFGTTIAAVQAQQRPSLIISDRSLNFHVDGILFKPSNGSAEDATIAISSCTTAFAPNTNQTCRLASGLYTSVVVAATWVGVSMYCPLEALATVYVTDYHHNVGESVMQGHPTRSGNLDMRSGQFGEAMPDVQMETLVLQVGNVPSIQPPNGGLNSPWIPKLGQGGLKKGNESKRRTAVAKCPPWSMSELEMVLPDFQGKPKPFPRMQGQVYPFWPAAANMLGNADSGDRSAHDRDSSKDLPEARPDQSPPTKIRPRDYSCFSL